MKVDLEVWPEMIHGWWLVASVLPEGQYAIDKIGQFVRQKTVLAIMKWGVATTDEKGEVEA